MTGPICLQGGGEFAPSCQQMDADLLARAGGGPVVLVPLAARPGREYAAAGLNGLRYFTALGAEATIARDFRADPAAAVAEVAAARLVFLPGGAPTRIRSALLGTAMGAALVAVHSRGDVLVGASAGAMVLCEHMWLPDGGERVAPGLGLVRGVLVVPHHRAPPSPVAPVAGVRQLGLPECSGVVVTEGGLAPLGAAPAVWIDPDGTERAL